jgi:RNA-binding protein PNO1
MEVVTAAEMETEQVDMQTGGEDQQEVPSFPALSAIEAAGDQQYMRITVPPNRYTPLKNHWMEIYQPIAEHMKLQIRFNPRKRCVELRTSPATELANAMTKSCDFVRAFMMGFEIRDAIALLRLDDLYIDSFEIKDVKTLQGEHLSRAIGRIAGQGGKTRHTIENATKTRIVLADTHVHILGSFTNSKIAKDAIVRLIMGSPPGKVYTQMRSVSARSKDRF